MIKLLGKNLNNTFISYADCIQLKPVQANKIHLVDSINVHSNIEQRTVLPTERVIVYFLSKRHIAEVSINHNENYHVFTLV